MNIRKRFDKGLYEVADKDAKAATLRWLKNSDFITIDTTERKDYDITCKDKAGKKYLFEVEIKYSWRNEWPIAWKEIRIPHRKNRLINKWQNQCPDDSFTFIVFRNDCKQAWQIDANILLTCEVKEASNRDVIKGELFFHIPVEQAKMISIP